MKNLLLAAVFVLTFISQIGCSIQNKRTCKQWIKEGDFYSTIDSCAECVDQLGNANKEVVKGCAMGLDATKLIGSK